MSDPYFLPHDMSQDHKFATGYTSNVMIISMTPTTIKTIIIRI